MEKSKKQTQIVISIILVLAVIAFCGIIASRYVVENYLTINNAQYSNSNLNASTTTDGNFEYNILDDGTVEIIKYVGTETEVTIPKTIDGKSVTRIGDAAFEYCSSLTSIEIPKGVTSIGSFAFHGCTSLTSIEIPKGVTSIGEGVFLLCSSLTSVEIPEGVTSIGGNAFNGCGSLTNIEILEGVISIGDDAFRACTSLTNIEIPEGVTSIGNFAFEYCSSLESITIPDSVTSIMDGAFNGCGALTIYCRSNSTAEKYAESENISYIIDDYEPTVENVTGNATEWTNENVILTIEATDKLSGLAKEAYSFNGGEKWEQENTKEYSENTSGIVIKVRDNLGNIYTHETINITNIDKEVPVAGTLTMKLEDNNGSTYTNDTWTDQNVYIQVNNGSDEHSGHKKTTYSINGGTETTEPQTITQSGTYNIIVITTDNAGNTSTNSYIVKIRKAENLLVTSYPKKMGYNAYENFDKDGMGISIQYDNGDIEEIKEYTVVNGENLTCKVTKIEIQYNGNPDIKVELPIRVSHDIQEATCTEIGKCKIEGCTYTQEALGHDYNARVIQPTCTEKGYTTHQCTRCEDSYVDTHTDALGHSFTNYVLNNDATCTQDGTKTAKCDRCDVTDTLTDEGSKKPHTEEIDARVEPTCTQTGLTEGKHCQVCQTVTVGQQEIEALGHNYESKVKEPTCIEKGYTTHQCTRCEDSYVDTYTDALGHNFTNYVSNDDATCTQDGTKTAKCDRCDATDTVTEEGRRGPHNYKNGTCSECGEAEPKLQITSERYGINELYITKIQVKTTIKEFKENIETNTTEINIYNKQNEKQEEGETLATGMTVEFKYGNETKTYTIVVAGDVNGDGKIKLTDMSMVNRYRLNKIKLEGAYLLAGDVTGDAKVNFMDLVKINRRRLNKITEL